MAHTELLYLRDAYLRKFDATVVAVDGQRVALDRTAFYPTGGGQPHDTGALAGAAIVGVRKECDLVWHTVEGQAPSVGDVECIADRAGLRLLRVVESISSRRAHRRAKR